jgi:N-acetylglucosaminyldiphosphoundecaprenol N-acetyl-beta-D-mannosaminyltransferase
MGSWERRTAFSTPRFMLLGVAVDRVDLEGAIARIDDFVREGVPRQVVTVNPEFVIAARRDRRFRRVLNAADLAVADGVGIVWAANLLGDRLRERVGGVEVVECLAARAARAGHRLYLLGAEEGVAAEAARRLELRHPGLSVAGTFAGSPRPQDEAGIRERILEAHPDVLLVAFGAPAQEFWIARNLQRLGVPVAIGVGGAFDYLAGRASRAPVWLQRAGLEWLYRLARQPWRWRRMLALPRFAALVLASAALLRLRRLGRP